MTSRPSYLLLAAIAAAATGLSILPAAAHVPHGTKVLTPTGKSTLNDVVDPLAGSTNRLVYSARPIVTDAFESRVDESGPDTRLLANPVLRVRTRAGKVTELGSVPDDVGWSTVGHVVTGQRVNASRHTTRVIDIWDLSSGHHQTFTLPAGGELAAAVPDGLAYNDGDTLRRYGIGDGSDTDWGTPFSGQAPNAVVTNSTELVVSDSAGDVSVMSYAHPGVYTPLNSGASTAVCRAVDHQGAACDTNLGVTFVPLDGSPSSSATPCTPGEFHPEALSGRTLLWTEDCNLDTVTLFSLTAGDPTVHHATNVQDASPVVSAYGEGVTTDDFTEPFERVLAGTTAQDVHPLFTSRSPETAGSFALTAGRVAYVSDRRDRARPGQLTLVRAARITARTHHVAVSRLPDIGGSVGDQQVQVTTTSANFLFHSIATDGDTTAYVIGRSSQAPWHVRVVTRRHAVTLPPTVEGNNVQVSGHRVLFTHRGKSGGYVGVYNTRTGHIRHVFHNRRQVALSGTHIAYARFDGRIFRYSLRSGHSTLVYKPKSPSGGAAVVFEHGRWVGWSIATPRRHGLPSISYGVRDMRARGRVIRVPHTMYGLNGRGALLMSAHDVGDRELATTWFRPYSGHQHRLLSSRVYDELPQLVGHALAWVSIDGNLKVAPYRY